MDMTEVVPASTRARGIQLMAAAAAIYLLLDLIGVHKLFAADSEGLAALLAIIGTLYSVVYAFATYVIWGQFAAVENEILKESGALKDLILFSKALKEAIRDPIVRAVRAYARVVTESEWGILSRGESTDRTDKLFIAIITAVIEARLKTNPNVVRTSICSRLPIKPAPTGTNASLLVPSAFRGHCFCSSR